MYHVEAGIGVELSLASTQLTRRFLDDFPPHLGKAVDANDMCVPVMFPDELARAGLGGDEKDKLHELASNMLASLGEAGIIGASLRTIPNILKPLKGILAIELVDEEGLCSDIRSVVSEILKDGINVDLRSYLDRNYIKVAERRPHIARPVKYWKHFPPEFVISGCKVGVQNVGYTRDGQPSNYVNSCHRSRR